ncbi:MAG TPA: transcriptional regulator [Vicinamibacterales bacterium]|nr:transcriptional regulator [Vicinamibacterales bacterium]
MAAKAARRAAPARPVQQAAPKDAQRLDRLIHDRVRLGILSALASVESMSFADLKSALEVSDGNLSVHARKLEDAGYLICDKTFVGRTPRTDFRLAPSGRRAFEKYLDHMDALISAARKARP